MPPKRSRGLPSAAEKPPAGRGKKIRVEHTRSDGEDGSETGVDYCTRSKSDGKERVEDYLCTQIKASNAYLARNKKKISRSGESVLAEIRKYQREVETVRASLAEKLNVACSGLTRADGGVDGCALLKQSKAIFQVCDEILECYMAAEEGSRMRIDIAAEEALDEVVGVKQLLEDGMKFCMDRTDGLLTYNPHGGRTSKTTGMGARKGVIQEFFGGQLKVEESSWAATAYKQVVALRALIGTLPENIADVRPGKV